MPRLILVLVSRRAPWTLPAALALVLLALLASVAPAHPASNAMITPTAPTPPAEGKIAPTLRVAFHDQPTSPQTFIVLLAEQADTHNDITDWTAKGRYVLDRLQKVAAQTQPAVAAVLTAEQHAGNVSSFRPYHIVNGFAVVGNWQAVQQLAALSAVGRIEDAPVFHLDTTAAPHAP